MTKHDPSSLSVVSIYIDLAAGMIHMHLSHFVKCVSKCVGEYVYFRGLRLFSPTASADFHWDFCLTGDMMDFVLSLYLHACACI